MHAQSIDQLGLKATVLILYAMINLISELGKLNRNKDFKFSA